jgi:hypothetical protein
MLLNMAVDMHINIGNMDENINEIYLKRWG